MALEPDGHDIPQVLVSSFEKLIYPTYGLVELIYCTNPDKVGVPV